MSGLNFYWRMGDYAIEACPRYLARLSKDEQNETIDFVKYYQYQGRECKYSIGYFRYNEHEPCWELKFVGDRFSEIGKEDIIPIFEMLKAAYSTLTEWKNKQEDNTDDT